MKLSIDTPAELAEARPCVVQIRDLGKWYGAFQVLKTIDLDVHQGERVVTGKH